MEKGLTENGLAENGRLLRKETGYPGMKRNRAGELQYLTFPALEETGVAVHLVSSRLGGVSTGDCASLNFSYARDPDAAAVDENFRRLARVFGKGPGDFVCSDQTHTTHVRRVTGADRGKGVTVPRDYREVDGLVTDEPGLILSTFYADCVPLLFVDPVRRAVGCSHSGWRGTVEEMGRVTVEAMEEAFGSRPGDIRAAIGPSICGDCYEVGEEVAQAFLDRFCGERYRFAAPEKLVRKKGGGKYLLDLWRANEAVLLAAGILREHLAMTDVCTCCNPGYLFSHRASHGRRGNFGAFIMLRDF
ncbi:MAG: peptidoglycan editing factor PgeF [Eubacteriales bacterium]|nr:peptidoglycan editing factor PgeF [Eubacteriales bacterium]